MAATVLGGFSRVGADSRLPGGIRSGVRVGGEVFVHSRRKKAKKKGTRWNRRLFAQQGELRHEAGSLWRCDRSGLAPAATLEVRLLSHPEKPHGRPNTANALVAMGDGLQCVQYLSNVDTTFSVKDVVLAIAKLSSLQEELSRYVYSGSVKDMVSVKDVPSVTAPSGPQRWQQSKSTFTL